MGNSNAMKPITFERSRFLPKTAAEICAEIQDVARWQEFEGYGFLPGIKHAKYEVRTDNMVDSRIRVHNEDGSGHVEEILVWIDSRHIVMQLHEFTPPLNQLASHFMEEWHFDETSDGTLVTRSFQLYPRKALTRPILWLISLVFRRAIDRHLTAMADE